MTKDSILAVLPSLSPQELTELQSVIGQLLNNAPQAVADAFVCRPLFDALTSALGVRIALSQFVQGNMYRHWQKHAPVAMTLISEQWPGPHTRLIEGALYRLIIDLVVTDLQKRLGHQPSIGMVITNLGRVPQLYDNAYPGYRESGISRLVLEALIKQ